MAKKRLSTVYVRLVVPSAKVDDLLSDVADVADRSGAIRDVQVHAANAEDKNTWQEFEEAEAEDALGKGKGKEVDRGREG